MSRYLIIVLQTTISFVVIIDGKYQYNSHASPISRNTRNETSNRFQYVTSKPVTEKSPLKMASHSPDYFHYHYMQNLRRQFEKPDDDQYVSALTGPTKHQILGKPSSDVELSILEDLQRQTKNFTLDDVKPVLEKDDLKDVNEDKIKRKTKFYHKIRPKHKEKKQKVTSHFNKKTVKETYTDTRTRPDKSGKARTIRTQKTVTYTSTMKPKTKSKKYPKKSRFNKNKKHEADDSNEDSVETSDSKKIFMTTMMKKRSKSLNPHLYTPPKDGYRPIDEEKERENYSMEWDDKYNVKDFTVRRSDVPDYDIKTNKKRKRQSGEIPMMDVFRGGVFRRSMDLKENDDYYYDQDEDELNDYYDEDGNQDDENAHVKKKYQDIYSKQSYPYSIEFGHLYESPYGWEERFQDMNFKTNRHRGKVIWMDEDGDFGQHYWDLNP